MMGQSYARHYQQTQVATADRGRLLLLMLEGGLKFLKLTSEAAGAEDWNKFAHFLSKSQAVIAELMNTLDHNVGEGLSRDLERLYDFMLHHLTEANVSKSRKRVDDVIRVFSIIADAFRQAIEQDAGSSITPAAAKPGAPAAEADAA